MSRSPGAKRDRPSSHEGRRDEETQVGPPATEGGLFEKRELFGKGLERLHDIIIAASHALRTELGLGEEHFRRIDPRGHDGNAKEYILYRSIDEAVKAAMHVDALLPLLEGEPTDEMDPEYRLAGAFVVEQEQMRSRRLCEALMRLVLFETTDEQPFYRHFLLLEMAEKIFHRHGELRRYHGAQNASIEAQIRDNAARIAAVEQELDHARIWGQDPDLP